MSTFSAGGGNGAPISATLAGATTYTPYTTTIAVANIEQSYTVPAATKILQIVTEEQELYWSTSAGTSATGTKLYRWCSTAGQLLSLTGITIYFQSPQAGMRVYINTWQ